MERINLKKAREVIKEIIAIACIEHLIGGVKRLPKKHRDTLRTCLELIDRIEKELNKIPSDDQINKFPNPDYARAYNQGKFDILMDLKLNQER